MKIYFCSLLILGIVVGCSTSDNINEKMVGAVKISSGEKAEGSYLTKDHKGNPVIVWTQEDSAGVFVYYVVSEDSGRSFGKPIRVTSSKGTRFHGESMNKIGTS